MESKWRRELYGPVIGHAGRRISHHWDRWLLSAWLLTLSFCIAFWVLVGLVLSQIDWR